MLYRSDFRKLLFGKENTNIGVRPWKNLPNNSEKAFLNRKWGVNARKPNTCQDYELSEGHDSQKFHTINKNKK